MTKIKICGLSRPCDIMFVNEAVPDFCGFIIDVPKSHRTISAEQLRQLRPLLNPEITPVGVFVNAPAEAVASLLNQQLISAAQLHGQEDDYYISRLRSLTSAPIIQAFQIHSVSDLILAEKSPADLILLDSGAGSGHTFDWSLLSSFRRPYLLAGGLTPENIPAAILSCKPWGIDLSSGVEKNQLKCQQKIKQAVEICRCY